MNRLWVEYKMHGTTYSYLEALLKKEWTENDSISWVIDALENRSVEKRLRENHKYDEVRADQDLKWCPQCKCKWEIFEGKVWSSIDKKLWKELICPDCHVR
jgi:hypothetical protein